MGAAIDSLIDIKKKYPNIVLRMIALTDGEDNYSKKQKPEYLVQKIIKNQIIIDTFVVGDKSLTLKAITKACGG